MAGDLTSLEWELIHSCVSFAHKDHSQTPVIVFEQMEKDTIPDQDTGLDMIQKLIDTKIPAIIKTLKRSEDAKANGQEDEDMEGVDPDAVAPRNRRIADYFKSDEAYAAQEKLDDAFFGLPDDSHPLGWLGQYHEVLLEDTPNPSLSERNKRVRRWAEVVGKEAPPTTKRAKGDGSNDAYTADGNSYYSDSPNQIESFPRFKPLAQSETIQPKNKAQRMELRRLVLEGIHHENNATDLPDRLGSLSPKPEAKKNTRSGVAQKSAKEESAMDTSDDHTVASGAARDDAAADADLQ